jgi:signal recognition particle receptor subunit beta
MVFFNWATMQMAAKIVYYGPGLCGKTSNLSFIYAKTAPNSRGEMVSLETESDRTLFFDLLPIEVGNIGGFKTRLQLYTVPGQVFYNTTRKLVLKGVDGLVFVADSQRPMREANIESLQSLRDNLEELGLDMADLPLVLQFNKRDLKNILAEEELNADLNPDGDYSWFGASAINGDGVFETLKEITKLTLKKLRRKMAAPHQSTAETPPTTFKSRPEPSTPKVDPVRPDAGPAKPSPSISAASLIRAAEEGVDDVPSSPDPSPHTPAEVPVPAEPPAPVEASAPSTPLEADQPETEPAPTPDDVFDADPAAVAPPVTPPAEAHQPSAPAAPAEPRAEELPAPAPEPQPSQPQQPAVAEAPTPPAPEPVPEPAAAAETPAASTSAGAPAEVEPQTAADSPSDPDTANDAVEFARDADDRAKPVQPPPMKRVQVSNQMDILSELDNLRHSPTLGTAGRGGGSNLDLDALLKGDKPKSQDLQRRIEKDINSDIFQRMHQLQFAVRIQDKAGDTVHTLDPVSLIVKDAASLEKLILQFTVDLKNTGS